MRRSIEQIQIEEIIKSLDFKKRVDLFFFLRFKKHLRAYKTENSFFIWLLLSVFLVSIYFVDFFLDQDLGYRITFAYGLASFAYVIMRIIQAYAIQWVDSRNNI